VSTDLKVFGVLLRPNRAPEIHPAEDLQDGKSWLHHTYANQPSPVELKLIRVRHFREETEPTEEVVSIWKK